MYGHIIILTGIKIEARMRNNDMHTISHASKEGESQIFKILRHKLHLCEYSQEFSGPWFSRKIANVRRVAIFETFSLRYTSVSLRDFHRCDNA